MSTWRVAGLPSTVEAKKQASSSENTAAGKASAGTSPPIAAKKRPPLSNLTNQRRGSFGTTSSMVPCTASRVVRTKKECSTSISDTTLSAITYKSDVPTDIKAVDNVVDVDENVKDPQLCAAYACDIYKHLRVSETEKRPSTDFMEKIQQDINASMRSTLVDWLVEVSEEYRLVSDTLYLTINYIDRYLSGNSIKRQRLQLLGVACMMIAAKYEEISAPHVEVFCYITDNTYFREEVLEMESSVLSCLNFEMTAPTTKCFLRRFVGVAQASKEASTLKFECMANYIAELSLPEYHMLQYAPSVTAASTVFLANYILSPSRKPWNTTLQYYTLYEPLHLQDCVQALHKLCLNGHGSNLRSIREKYSQHEYKFAAKKYCPPMIPPEYFCTVSSS